MGTTGMSFGGGFASGIATALSNKRQRDEQDKSRQISNLWKGIGFLVDSGQVSDIADLQPQFDALSALGAFGDPKAIKKGQPGPQDHVTNILGHIIRKSGGGVERGTPTGAPQVNALPLPGAQQPQGPTGPNDAGDMIAPTELPSTNLHMTPQAPQRRTLMGIPLLTHEEQITRGVNDQVQQQEQQLTARVALARRAFPMLKDAGLATSPADVMAWLGVRPPTGMYGTTPQVGSFGDYVKRTEGELGRVLSPDEVETARREWTASGQSLGMWMERAAPTLGYGSAAEARAAGKGDELNAAATKLQAEAGGAVATARGKATNEVSKDKPIDITTAQSTGLPVGTTPREVQDQSVPTAEQRQRTQSTQNLKAGLEEIRNNLLWVLPNNEGLQGLAPGAIFTARKRMPSYREGIARLEAQVNNLVNVVARSVAEQRGTQTEQDALRAEAAIVSLRDSLVRGDTQESAKARIDQTLKTLEQILGNTPGTPVRRRPGMSDGSAAPSGKPAAGPTGAVMRDGHLFINGVQID